MRDILQLFLSPEECAKDILAPQSPRTIPKALISLAKIIILLGCIVGLTFKTSLPNYLEVVSQIDPDVVDKINQLSATNLGVFAIIITPLMIVFLYLGAILIALIMATLLFAIKSLMGGKGTFKQLFTITLYAQVIYNSVMLVTQVCVLIATLTFEGGIMAVILRIVSIFQLWYLVFVVVAFNIVNRVSFFKSIVATFAMQGFIWVMQFGLIGLISVIGMMGQGL